MVQALRYIDEKSDKFWKIETSGCELVMNWGKTGTAGRYEIKEFDSSQDCEQQALKYIAAKQKKGYKPMPDFNSMEHFYFDTGEYGPHPLTSHPTFRKYCSDELYYDCADEEAPFGSDEGSDTFWELQETLRKRSAICFSDFPRTLIEKQWKLTYLPPEAEQTEDELRKQALKTYHSLPGDQELLQTDQVILATAFGQLKIMGKLDAALQSLALLSLDRMEKMYRFFWGWSEENPPYNIMVMRRDITHFIHENN